MKMMLGWGAAWAAQHSSASVTSLIIKLELDFSNVSSTCKLLVLY
jgi:hypothetical protein